MSNFGSANSIYVSNNLNYGNISHNNSGSSYKGGFTVPNICNKMANTILESSGMLNSNIETYTFGNASISRENKEYIEVDELISYKYDKIDYTDVLEDGFKVQGVTQIGDKVILSAYDHSKQGRNSRLFFYDALTGEKNGYIILDSKAHVGGTTYVEDLGILFVSNSKGKTTALDFRKRKI